MSEHHDSPYEESASETENRPMRRGWFFYVAGFFLVLAGICFVLANNLNYQPGPLLPPVHADTGK